MTVYRRTPVKIVSRAMETPGAVICWEGDDGLKKVVFACPCGERTVLVREEDGHTVTFDGEGRLHIKESCGYRAMPKLNRLENWCHFHIHAGQARMCGDAKCPGRK